MAVRWATLYSQAAAESERADRAGPLGQNEKRRLEYVLNVLLVTQHLPTDHPHQPAMSIDDLGKRRLVAMADELHEELAIGSSDRGSSRAV